MFFPDKRGLFTAQAAAVSIAVVLSFPYSAKAADDWGEKKYGRHHVGKGGDFRAKGGTQLYSSKDPAVRADIFLQEETKLAGFYDAGEPAREASTAGMSRK